MLCSSTRRPPARALALLVATLAVVLAAGCSGGDDDPDVSAYCPAEEELLNAQVALKTTNDPEALAEAVDEVEQLTEQLEEEAPELIEEQVQLVAEQTYEVLEQIRSEELSPADASDRLTGQFADQEVATANAVIAAFDAEFCPDFEGTIPSIPDPGIPLPGAGGEVPTVPPEDGDSTTSTP